ncbi:MAG: CcoQ/FixQ family Cbb3-type cytochrome c oxidase assembly chaperone [Xanthomonadales bacterium]|nr:CcoQ/FixQ family Cbb3-type cytochrome c oxidase assembly chaperone [Xanthomonadales bacterium]
MDAGTVQGLITLLALLAFLAMVAWVFAPSRRCRFDEAARLPLEEEEKP